MSLADQIQALYAKFGALKGITIEIHKQLVAIAVKNEVASATIFLQGAQVAEYARLDESPLLWLSEQNTYSSGRSLRGGIPVCWPWFGDLARNPDAVKGQLNMPEPPAHGFVRSQEWELLAVELLDSRTTQLTLQLEVLPTEVWPFPVVLRMVISVGSELSIELKVSNIGVETFSYTSALHTYLNVGHVDQASVVGLEGITYIDTLADWTQGQSEESITVSEETDRIYKNVPSSVVLHDELLQRRIEVVSQNTPDMVVWNPWIEKSKRLSNFSENDYLNMICLENAAILDNFIQLEPGKDALSKITLRSKSI